MSTAVGLPLDRPAYADGARAGGWWHVSDGGDNRIVCDLCPRECHLKPGDRGFCFVRENRAGEMALTTYGRSTGFCIDPVEKKPLNHFYPGVSVLSFGTAGCNLGCKFCQNHDISKSREVARLSESASPAAIARAAVDLGCRAVAFTYNDPVIWAEYAIDTARECRAAGVKTIAVTAGYITPQAREPFFAAMDAANVDLKGFTEDFYQHLTLSHLAPVLETLRWLKKETDVWFEITNLIIPRANDSADELRRLCDWVLEALGDDTPVHFTAFHPDYKLTDRERTPAATLVAAYEQAQRTGLKYVYVGNVHDRPRQSTWCPSCKGLLIERNWHELGAWRLAASNDGGDARCGHCGCVIVGRFEERPGDWGRKRQPVRMARYADASSLTGAPLPIVNITNVTTMIPTEPIDKPRPAPAPVRSGPPELSDEQRRLIHHAACEMAAAAVLRRPASLPDLTLAGAADLPLWGVFVSAKRFGHLRGCCGSMGRTVRLIDALSQAAGRTAAEDVRLPPLSPSELSRLEIEVWLLFDPTIVAERGANRASAVTIGRHGLQIARGDKRGLLLPGVAVEHQYSPEAFLRQVSLKAGLPLNAWKDDQAELATFEGISIRGPFDGAIASQAPPAGIRITAADLEALATHCRRNLDRLLAGDTPNYYLFDAFDGAVSGATLSLRPPVGDGALHFARLSLRPGVPLQATLMELVDAAAKAVRARTDGGARGETLRNWQVDLTVLDDPALAGTAADCNLSDEPAERAIVLVERNKSCWLHGPQTSPAELLETGKRQLHVADAQRTSVFTFRAAASHTPVIVVHGPRPLAGGPTRRAAMAGAFYPALADELERELDGLFHGLLEGASDRRSPCRAVMLPHAGWKYSGRIAAQVLAQTDFEKLSDTIIVIGPKHTPHGVDWSAAPHERWEYPGGEVAANLSLAEELVQAIPGLEFDAAAHQQEHAVEVELPLLARVRPGCRIVALAIGAAGLAECREFARGLSQVIARQERPPLLVISSDMNHFADDAETRKLDEIALSAMEGLDAERLFGAVRDNHISMCGVLPAVIVMQALQNLGALAACQRIAYGTSADATGETARVVGYAGVRLL